jgi:hypothetical protein
MMKLNELPGSVTIPLKEFMQLEKEIASLQKYAEYHREVLELIEKHLDLTPLRAKVYELKQKHLR